MRETRTGQQVAQLHERFMMMMIGKHSILYDWKDPGCTRKEKNDIEWENIKQGLNKMK